MFGTCCRRGLESYVLGKGMPREEHSRMQGSQIAASVSAQVPAYYSLSSEPKSCPENLLDTEGQYTVHFFSKQTKTESGSNVKDGDS